MSHGVSKFLSPFSVDKVVHNSFVHCFFAYKNAFFARLPKKRAHIVNPLIFINIFVSKMGTPVFSGSNMVKKRRSKGRCEQDTVLLRLPDKRVKRKLCLKIRIFEDA
jgi:hypothetical protein